MDWQKFFGLPLAPPQDQPEYGVEFHSADGVWLKQIVMPKKDTILPQHVHAWPHLTMVATGAVIVWVDGKILGRFDAPAGIKIEAGKAHAFQALGDNTTLWCIHGLHSEAAQQMVREHGLSEEID